MRERFPGAARARVLPLLIAAVVAGTLAACGEKLDQGAACPALCPTQDVVIKDTVLDPITLDTAIAGFPSLGTEALMLLAARGDTLDTRGIIRFDTIPKTYSKNSGDSAITTVDSSYLMLHLDSLGTLATQPVTVEAYDVDTTATDTSTAILTSLFRPDRLIGSATFATTALKDSIRVPLSNVAMLRKVKAGVGLRVGLRAVSSASVQLSLFTQETLGPGRLSFTPSPDTTVTAFNIAPTSQTGTGPLEKSDLRDFTLVVKAPQLPTGAALVIGGLPARRSFLQFNIPRHIVDSSTVLRATLLLTQQSNPNATAKDTLVVYPQLVAASATVLDVSRAADVLQSANALIDSVRIAPKDSGLREIDIVNALRNWKAQISATTQTQRALVLRSALEGSSSLSVSFYSTEAPSVAQRPRLRVSYVERLNFGRP